MAQRLQKFLAQAGIASRRKCEELIVAGEVEIDGQVVTELGTTVDPGRQTVKVRGQMVQAEATVCLVLHKPVSYVTTVTDPEGRRTVMDLIKGVAIRVYPVGRLDYDTSGLLLFSNDGELTYRLLHPKHHIDKIYRATILGMPTQEAIRQLESGVVLDDGTTSPSQVTVLRNHPLESVIELTIHEGKNRQVRRMLEAVGHPVKRLKRIQLGPLELGSLAIGEWRLLSTGEMKLLYASVGLEPPQSMPNTADTPQGTVSHPVTKGRAKTAKPREEKRFRGRREHSGKSMHNEKSGRQRGGGPSKHKI